MAVLCDGNWSEETENSHRERASLRALCLKEQEVNEVLGGISGPEKNILLTESFLSYL